MTVTLERPWWKDAVFYQVYPASFKDSNGDGIGDIPGVISKLDYIKSIGIDAIWLCPMYESPQVDMGYDISDYENVHKPYGTLQDMETLIEECHARDIRLILDLVINHTSDQHAWFKQSRSSKDDPKRDWYIWRPAKFDADGKRVPPNNWRSNFGGSSWTWDEHTQQYYLHLFCPEQPDLNWENPITRAAIYESAILFWLEKGIDGFRVDTINMYSKDPVFADAKIVDATTPWQNAAYLYCNGPRIHEYITEMAGILSQYGAMTVGELPATPDMSKVLRYISAKENQLNMVFQFDVVVVGMGENGRFETTPHNWTLKQMKDAVGRTQGVLDGTDAWTTSFLENHDQARSISRYGSDKTPVLRNLSGKMLAVLNATLSGTLFVYQGQEIGAISAPRDWPVEEYKDVDSQNWYKYIAEKTGNDPKALEEAMDIMHYLARDHSRMPMQWDASAHAGFTSPDAKPWMRVHDDYANINVKKEELDPDSVLNFWRRVLKLRKEHNDVFVHGSYSTLDYDNEKVFTYKKSIPSKTIVVVLNFTEEEQPFESTLVESESQLLISNTTEKGDKLKGFEARVYIDTK